MSYDRPAATLASGKITAGGGWSSKSSSIRCSTTGPTKPADVSVIVTRTALPLWLLATTAMRHSPGATVMEPPVATVPPATSPVPPLIDCVAIVNTPETLLSSVLQIVNRPTAGTLLTRPSGASPSAKLGVLSLI